LDLAHFNYGRPKVADDASTLGAKELEAPFEESQPHLDEDTRCSPSTIAKPIVVVKMEDRDF